MSGSGICWAICKFALSSRHASTPPLKPDALPATQPTASKHWRLILQKAHNLICVESAVKPQTYQPTYWCHMQVPFKTSHGTPVNKKFDRMTEKYTDRRGERASVCRLDPAPWHTLLCKLPSRIAVLQPPGCVANPTESVPAKSHGAIGTVKGSRGTVVPKDNRAGADLRFLGSSWQYSPPGPQLPSQLQVIASTRSVIDRRCRPLCRHLSSYFMHTPFPHRYIRREITYKHDVMNIQPAHCSLVGPDCGTWKVGLWIWIWVH